MIGKIITGKSFRGCLNYLHESRLQPTKDLQDLEQAKKQAEIIAFNQCFGSKKELIQQFNEVRNINSKLSKPVFHATISLALEDSGKLSNQDKADLVAELAKTFGFEHNQYLAITHGDTHHEHLHVVANRIGYDGKTASDSNSYKRMAAYCRKMELAYNLTKVLSPAKFLTPAEKKAHAQTPRVDNRKERLKADLKNAIAASTNLPQLKKLMEAQYYSVELGRGIAFTDQQQVRFKGSQVGYALRDIEKALAKNLHTKLTQDRDESLIMLHQQSKEENNRKHQGRTL